MNASFKTMARILFVTGLVVAGQMPALAQDPLEAPRAQYDQHFERIDAEARQAREDAISRYSNALIQVEDLYRREGDLDALLEARKDKELFNASGQIPVAARPQSPDRVRKAHEIISRELDAAETKRRDSVLKLTQNYIAHLESMKRKLTTDGNLTHALAVREEIARVSSSKAYTAAQFEAAAIAMEQSAARAPAAPAPATEPPQVANVPAFRFHFAPLSGKSQRAGLEPEGDAGFRGMAMAFGGGRIVLRDSGETIQDAFRASNALTLEAIIVTASLDQRGPARILGSSLDGALRNVSLCQEGKNLVLRLRTSKTNKNGTQPEIVLGPIVADEPHHVVVSYRPGLLTYYLDGRAIEVANLEGNFSNWDAYPLVFGNEYKADRAWKGALRAASVENVFVTEEGAAQRFATARARLIGKPQKKPGGMKRFGDGLKRPRRNN